MFFSGYDPFVRVALLFVVGAGCGRFRFEDDARLGSSDALTDDGGSTIDMQSSVDAFVNSACLYQCAIDVLANSNTCSAAVSAMLMGSRGTAVINMSGYTELELRAMICDPTEWVLHLGDSPTNDGQGGDVGTTSNDAEAHFIFGTQYQVWGNDYVSGAAKTLADVPNALPASGCSSVVMIVRDQYIEVAQPVSNIVNSQYALRINPPTDMEGTPDALWYLGMNRTIGSMLRTGTGLQNVSLCLR